MKNRGGMLVIGMMLVVGLMVALAGTAAADGEFGNGLTWALVDGTLTISKTGEGDGQMTYDTVPWYLERSNITKVVIRKGVTSIGKDAFYYCQSLESVTIPNGVTSIGNYAFERTALSSITIPGSVTSIGKRAFYDNPSLGHIFYTGAEGQVTLGEDWINTGLLAPQVHYTEDTAVRILTGVIPDMGESVSVVCDGTVQNSDDLVTKDSHVTVEAPELSGYEFARWEDEDGNLIKDAYIPPIGNYYRFTAEQDRTLIAVFAKISSVTVDTGITNGTVTVNKNKQTAGWPVIVTPTPENGYRLKTLTYTPDGGTAVEIAADDEGVYQFLMPEDNVTVSAEYIHLPIFTVEFGVGHEGFAQDNFSEKAGFSVSGSKVGITMPAGSTIGEAREMFMDASAALIGQTDNGECFLEPIALNPVGSYASRNDVNAETNLYDSQILPDEGVTYYAHWAVPVGNVTVTIIPPEPGTEITLENLGLATQRSNPAADAVVTGKAALDTDSARNWAESSDYSGYFVGTVAAGQECYASFSILADYGYYFPNAESVTVTNGTNVSVTIRQDRAAVKATIVVAPTFGTPDFVLPASVTTVEAEAFMGIAATVVEIPADCTSVGDYAFRYCPGLKQIRIPAGCTLGTDVFDGCELVYVYGAAGSSAEAYCLSHGNCMFVPIE